MINSELVGKKTIKHKKHPKMVGVLKKSIKATMITKCIQDLGINLIIGGILAFALATEK